MSVGLVVVAHSALLADGIAEICAQVAPDVVLVAAGGTDDGRIGTSVPKVASALALADSGDGVVLLGDLGSALLAAETAVDLDEDDARRGRVRIVDAPVVEGAVAAAVTAQAGGGLDAVARAAGGEDPGEDAGGTGERAPDAQADVVLPNADGLHARPAAALVKLAARFESAVRLDGADARSLLQVMALGRRQGDAVHVTASGPDAAGAVEAVRSLIQGGFGER